MAVPELHVYGQAIPHDDLFIMGNKAGLKALAAAIAEALNAGTAKSSTVFASDGEGFTVVASLEDALDHYAVPYTDDWSCESDRLKTDRTAMRLRTIVQGDEGDGAAEAQDVTPVTVPNVCMATFAKESIFGAVNTIGGAK